VATIRTVWCTCLVLAVLLVAVFVPRAASADTTVAQGRGLWYVQDSKVVYLDSMRVLHTIARADSDDPDVLSAGPTSDLVWERKRYSVVLLNRNGSSKEYAVDGTATKNAVSVGTSCWVELASGQIARIEHGVTTYYKNPLPRVAAAIFPDPLNGGILLYNNVPNWNNDASLVRLGKDGASTDVPFPKEWDRHASLSGVPLIKERPDGRIAVILNPLSTHLFQDAQWKAIIFGAGKPTVVVSLSDENIDSNMVSVGDGFYFMSATGENLTLLEISDSGDRKALPWSRSNDLSPFSLAADGTSIIGLAQSNYARTRLYLFEGTRLQVYELPASLVYGQLVADSDGRIYVNHVSSNVINIFDRGNSRILKLPEGRNVAAIGNNGDGAMLVLSGDFSHRYIGVIRTGVYSDIAPVDEIGGGRVAADKDYIYVSESRGLAGYLKSRGELPRAMAIEGRIDVLVSIDRATLSLKQVLPKEITTPKPGEPDVIFAHGSSPLEPAFMCANPGGGIWIGESDWKKGAVGTKSFFGTNSYSVRLADAQGDFTSAPIAVPPFDTFRCTATGGWATRGRWSRRAGSVSAGRTPLTPPFPADAFGLLEISDHDAEWRVATTRAKYVFSYYVKQQRRASIAFDKRRAELSYGYTDVLQPTDDSLWIRDLATNSLIKLSTNGSTKTYELPLIGSTKLLSDETLTSP
jgi:hypothetical protein